MVISVDNTSSNIVTNDLTRNILAMYDGDINFIQDWFIISSVASPAPKPGAPARFLGTTNGYLTVPNGGLSETWVDPKANYIWEFDPDQLDTCSCTYSFGSRAPAINLLRCRGALLRNVICGSVDRDESEGQQYGALTNGTSSACFYPLTVGELTSHSSTGSLNGSWTTTNTDDGTSSLLYVVGSKSHFIETMAKLALVNVHSSASAAEWRACMTML